MARLIALAYVASLVGLVVGIAISPEHAFRGRFATLVILVLFTSGLALAIHAL